MALTAHVLTDGDFDLSRSGSSLTVQYAVVGLLGDEAPTEADVLDKVRDVAAASVAGMPLYDLKATTRDRVLWVVTATYKPADAAEADPEDPEPAPDPAAPLTADWTFDVSGGTTRVTQSLATIARAGPGGEGFNPDDPADLDDPDAPDFGKAIGVTHDGVEGVDVYKGALEFSTTRVLPESAVTLQYLRDLAWLVGRTNDADWWGFKEGELLFLGASGQTKEPGKWSVTFKFAAGRHETDIAVGDFTVARKGAWEYLWVDFREDTSNARKVWTPRFAYVERVYGSGSYSLLKIT